MNLPSLDSIMTIHSSNIGKTFDIHLKKVSNVIKMCHKSICSQIKARDDNDFVTNIENVANNIEIAQFYIKYGEESKAFLHTLYTIKNRQNVYTSVIIEDLRVVYLLQYAVSSYKNKSLITQLLVWNDSSVKGLARKMLLYWLSKYDIVSNNPSQYSEDMVMWKRFIQEHINNLYFYKKVRNKKELERLTENFDESLLFGTTNEYRRILIWVSRKSLL